MTPMLLLWHVTLRDDRDQDCAEADQIDAATPPKLDNSTRCSRCRRLWGVRVHYCPGCPTIHGQHFHRLCPCGVTWDER